MKKKICTKCKEERSIKEFHKNKKYKDELSIYCKSCQSLKRKKHYTSHTERERERSKKYRKEHKKEVSEYNKKYTKSHRRRIKEYNRNYNKTHKEEKKIYKQLYRETHKTEIKEYNRKWINNNKEYKKIYENKNREKLNKQRNKARAKKYKENCLFRLSMKIRSAIRKTFKKNGFQKKSKTEQILGCSFSEFKLYIESKFEPWMNWNNYGKYNGKINFGWDFDHIIPINSAKTENDIIHLNYHTNIQPLCGYINRHIKRDMVDYSPSAL